jgi:hypothetical protein
MSRNGSSIVGDLVGRGENARRDFLSEELERGSKQSTPKTTFQLRYPPATSIQPGHAVE